MTGPRRTCPNHSWRDRRRKTCDDCREAGRVYMAWYRAQNPRARRLDRIQVRAYSLAERQVREAHREEFERYYTQHLLRLCRD